MRKKLIFLLILFSMSPVVVQAQTTQPASSPQPTWPATSGFRSASVCAECHVSIHKGWEGSMHANAINDPIFYPIFLETSRETDGKSDPLCLSCHAPTTRLTKDFKMKDALTREGVTCDFCHSVQGVNLGAADPFDVSPGLIKRGPLKGATSPVHQTAYSDVFEKPELCAGCHNFSNASGVPILETYTEWTKSPQAQEGKTCQTCHMPPVAGLVVPPKVKPTKEVYISSHEAEGGHSIDQVKKAVTIKMETLKRSGDKVLAVVRLENVGSGHKVPTGLPTRKLVLRFEASSGGVPIYSEERTFQKVILNEKGEVITKDSDLFLHAAKIKSDNRLEPRQPRLEDFSFFAPAGKSIEVEAKVYYFYQPRLIQETEMKVDLGQEKAVLPAQ